MDRATNASPRRVDLDGLLSVGKGVLAIIVLQIGGRTIRVENVVAGIQLDGFTIETDCLLDVRVQGVVSGGLKLLGLSFANNGKVELANDTPSFTMVTSQSGGTATQNRVRDPSMRHKAKTKTVKYNWLQLYEL
jgi:hypothetical protein